jgi:fermentation-respiration switch protein FrsA (DUF1100 family)
VFLIQGGSDLRMPATEGEKLFGKAKQPKELWTIPEADHGEVSQVAGKEHEDRILQFFQTAFSAPGRSVEDRTAAR